MKLFNSLSRTVEYFRPLDRSEVRIYSCGPTVYDHTTIGNLRTYIFDDTLRRALKTNGFKVHHVMNITDIDDKTIARSQEEFPDAEPLEALQKLTEKYQKIFLEDASKLSVDFTHTKLAKATQHIPEMQACIKQIADSGYAYTTDDGIYFDTLKYHNADNHAHPYGVLSQTALQGLATEEQRTGRDEYDKHEAVDFALWKAAKDHEPSWPFAFAGKFIPGRPGWHIECSAMSAKYLGEPFDIHTGGVDLIFPHHENEIAQTKAASGKLIAKYFVHGEHLLIANQRMGKSLDNFYVVDDITKKGYEPLSYRLLVLQAHYRTQLNFTWDSLEAAQHFLRRLQAWADLKFQTTAFQSAKISDYMSVVGQIKEALSDDLNSAAALGVLSELVSESEERGINPKHFQALLDEVDGLLGLDLAKRQDIENNIKDILAQRQTARSSHDWELSDRLREKLIEANIEVRDTSNGQIWRRL